MKSRHEHGLENEPHLRGATFQSDASESKAGAQIEREAQRATSHDQVEHSVWDGPGRAPELTGPAPEGAIRYATWFEAERARVTPGFSWLVTVGVALCAGPWAILGALFGNARAENGVLLAVVIAPIVEEIMKMAVPLWVVEKRPFWFRTRSQIAVCALASGLVFAAVENILYLKVNIADPSAALITWRWTVCVALHMGCALIASLGVMRIWSTVEKERTPPRLELAAQMLACAMLLHGAYNGTAVILEEFSVFSVQYSVWNS